MSSIVDECQVPLLADRHGERRSGSSSTNSAMGAGTVAEPWSLDTCLDEITIWSRHSRPGPRCRTVPGFTDLQVAEPPALERRLSSRPTMSPTMSQQVRRVGRPRQWASEAERKRAYRARRAAELVDPIGQRRAAQEARREAASQRSAAEEARREADHWRSRAVAAEKRAEAAERRAVRESAAARRFLAERDEARRLLRRKLQWAKLLSALRDEHARDV